MKPGRAAQERAENVSFVSQGWKIAKLSPFPQSGGMEKRGFV